MQSSRFIRSAGVSAAAPSRAVDTRAVAPRDVVSTWITNPLSAAAFVPRLCAGALAKGPAIVSEIGSSVSEIANTAFQTNCLTTGEKRETIANILNKQLDALLVRGTQLEIELFEQVDSVIDTSQIRPVFPQPLQQPPEVPDVSIYQNVDDSEPVVPTSMPTSESRSASALLQLQEAITNIQAALAEIESNEAPSRGPMLRLNMREAWDALRMRVEELESSPVEGVEGALKEAKELVDDLGDAFKFT